MTAAATATFVYDGDGNRVKGTVNGTTTTYVGNYYEWKGSTSTMVKYYYAAGARVAMRTGTAACTWLLADHLGSQSYVISNTGTTETGEQRYKPWGEERYSSGTTATGFRFTGQRLESDLGIYHYGARWYDPYLNRWIQPDTIIPSENGTSTPLTVDYHENKFLLQLNQENWKRLQDLNTKQPAVPLNPLAFDRYSYAFNNPVRYTDPDGHNPLLILIAIVGAFVFFSQVPSDVYQPDPSDQGDPVVMGIGAFMMVAPALIGPTLCGDGDCTNEAQQLVNMSSKTDVRSALNAGLNGLSTGQTQKALEILGKGRMDGVSLSLFSNGNVQMTTKIMGGDGGSFVQYLYTIDPSGKIIGLMQYAYNSAGELIHVHDKLADIVH